MSVDLSVIANTLLGRLGATSWTDLDWCQEAEVYGWFYEALGRLAAIGLFVENETIATQANQGVYTLPPDWIRTMFASVDGSQVRASSAAELLALDSAWPSAVCGTGETPSRYSLDAGSFGTITLYPQPAETNEQLELIDEVLPAQITPTQTTAPINALLQDYFLYFALERARRKESPNAMPELADAALQMVQMFEQVMASYWVGS